MTLKREVGFPGASDGKESACIAGDLGLIPGLGRSPGEGNGNPLHYSGLENSMYSLWGRKELDTTERLPLSKYVGGGEKQGLKFREKSGFCNLFTQRVPFCSSHKSDTTLAVTHSCSLGEN